MLSEQVPNRYKKNLSTIISLENQQTLLSKSILVIGCGGQGGYILDFLIRLGVKKIIIFDGDQFEESNLNRQLFCTEQTLNQSKIEIIRNKLKEINSTIILEYYNHYFTKNDFPLLFTIDCIINCANEYDKLTYYELGQFCINHNIPLINTGLSYNKQTNIQLIQNSEDLEEFYNTYCPNPKEEISQPAYACAIAAGIAIKAMIDIFCNHHRNIIQYNL